MESFANITNWRGAGSGCAEPTPSRRCSRRRGGGRPRPAWRSTSRRPRSRSSTPTRHAAELVVCCEVLEHLDDPERALEVLAGLARPWLIASVPREPLWRALNLARLSYVGALGNTPGHLNHWSKRGFERFLGERFEVVEVRSPHPVDHGALPRTIAALMSRLRQTAQGSHSARARASPPSSRSASPGASSSTSSAGPRWATSARCGHSPTARRRSISGTGRPTTRPGWTGTSTR